MLWLKSIRYNGVQTLLKNQKPTENLKHSTQNPHLLASYSVLSDCRSYSSLYSIFRKSICPAAEESEEFEKPQSVVVSEKSVGISELHSKKLDEEDRKENNDSLRECVTETKTKRKMKFSKLANSEYGDPMVQEELLSVTEKFAQHLFNEGYFKEETYAPKNNVFDSTYFQSSSAREYLKHATFEFGRDKRKIGRFLSFKDLQKVALFGCPSLSKKNIRAAKNVRKFLAIEEHMVCQKCTLKKSCKLADKQPDTEFSRLHLGSAIRVCVAYALESLPENVLVPDNIKKSVIRLLKQVINLSRTTP